MCRSNYIEKHFEYDILAPTPLTNDSYKQKLQSFIEQVVFLINIPRSRYHILYYLTVILPRLDTLYDRGVTKGEWTAYCSCGIYHGCSF